MSGIELFNDWFGAREKLKIFPAHLNPQMDRFIQDLINDRDTSLILRDRSSGLKAKSSAKHSFYKDILLNTIFHDLDLTLDTRLNELMLKKTFT